MSAMTDLPRPTIFVHNNNNGIEPLRLFFGLKFNNLVVYSKHGNGFLILIPLRRQPDSIAHYCPTPVLAICASVEVNRTIRIRVISDCRQPCVSGSTRHRRQPWKPNEISHHHVPVTTQ
jgi:hypothetical protein